MRTHPLVEEGRKSVMCTPEASTTLNRPGFDDNGRRPQTDDSRNASVLHVLCCFGDAPPGSAVEELNDV